MAPSNYPLNWPAGWKRTPGHLQGRARFNKTEHVRRGDHSFARQGDLTVSDARVRVLEALRKFGVLDGDAIVSTNLQTRLDGLPRSGQPEPRDPGVAVYWVRPTEPMRCMAIDRYERVADNLAAIAATLEAMRAIERHGGAMILDRAFTGFAALPAPAAVRDWREVLGVPNTVQTADSLRNAYRRAARAAHPDKGGTDARMAEVNAAYEAAQKAIGV
ncbi:MAG: DnaJ domain-containing protein [Pseudomonadota bacterium]